MTSDPAPRQPGRPTLLRRLLRVARWIVPVVILAVIFSRISLVELRRNLAHANPWLVALGLLYYPIVILTAGLRWRTVLAIYPGPAPPYRFLLRHYWIGLALGMFTPSMIGWDAYRVVVVGRHYGRYAVNAVAILIEKLMALLNAAVMVVVLFPFVRRDIVGNDAVVNLLLNGSYAVLAAVAAAALLVLFLGTGVRRALLRRLLDRAVATLLARFRRTDGGEPASTYADALAALARPLTRPWGFLGVFVISLGLQVIAAVGNQIFFRAIGYQLPLRVNLFALPIFTFVFLLPISFGSVGIREGAYILLYGLFGVPPETALLVSFFNLSGLLLNNAIGAALLWTTGSVRADVAAAAAEPASP